MKKSIILTITIILLGGLFYVWQLKQIETNQKVSITQQAEIITANKVSTEVTKLSKTRPVQTEQSLKKFAVKKIEPFKLPDSLASVFDELKSKADNGDLDAAHKLGLTLNRCIVVPRSETDSDAYIQKFAVRGKSEVAIKTLEMCKGVTDTQLLQSLDYLKLAASNNNMGALMSLAFAANPVISNKNADEIEKSTRLIQIRDEGHLIRLDALERAVNNGSMSAAMTLALDYDQGDFFPEKNKLKARSLYQVIYKLTGKDTVNNLINETERYLSHEEIVEAEKMALEIIDKWRELPNIYN